MKIGLFGGTFDPIHIGHLIVANTALVRFTLDKVVFVPAKVSPFKLGRQKMFTDKQIIEMINLSILDNEKFELSDFEILSESVSYTYLTVDYFSNLYNGADIYLVLGSDSFESFCKWKNYEQIIQKCKIIVYPRLGSSLELPKCLESFKHKVFVLQSPVIEISSTIIRKMIVRKEDFRYLVHDRVYEYIKSLM
ncbi:MAG: nicotinate-nucleotide adenylyltransferase [Brevinematales bacterium]|nr:nicotinate-nucleotide adenylyltransferase [Brevinematales bacterium]